MIRDGKISIVLKISRDAGVETRSSGRSPRNEYHQKTYWSRPPYISITRLILGRYQLSNATYGYSVVTEGRLAPIVSKKLAGQTEKEVYRGSYKRACA